MLDIPHGTTVPEMWPVFPNVNNQFNPFQPSVTFHMAVQTKWLVSIWNATLSWNILTAGNNDSIPKYLPEKTELYWKTVIFTRLFNKSQKKKKKKKNKLRATNSKATSQSPYNFMNLWSFNDIFWPRTLFSLLLVSPQSVKQ